MPRPRRTPAPVIRITHWIGALSMLVMIGSGWQIYNASPILPFTFPPWLTLGGWLAGGIAWHSFDAARITRPFPFNAYYGQEDVRAVDPAGWRLEVSGLVTDRRPWSLAQFRALPQKRQITRHICVEGWSAIGCWSGVPLSVFLHHVGADLRTKYVDFHCFDDYSTSIDMATALHPQTIMVLDFDDTALPAAYGAPMKVRIPTRLGYKNPKYLAAVSVTNRFPGGYWEDQGYDWFGGS